MQQHAVQHSKHTVASPLHVKHYTQKSAKIKKSKKRVAQTHDMVQILQIMSTSKISRLPHRIRQQLNIRLRDGEQGSHLVDWLNSFDETKSILARDFKGLPINEQNLSDWRHGGFRDWLRNQETHDRIDSFLQSTHGIDQQPGDQNIAARLSSLLAAELATETRVLIAQTSDPKERIRCISGAIRDLTILRNGETASNRDLRQHKDWMKKEEAGADAEVEARTEKMVRETVEDVTSPIWDQLHCNTLAKTLGSGPRSREAAEFLIDIYRIARGREPIFKQTTASLDTPAPTDSPTPIDQQPINSSQP
jgi:hypothetical protein